MFNSHFVSFVYLYYFANIIIDPVMGSVVTTVTSVQCPQDTTLSHTDTEVSGSNIELLLSRKSYKQCCVMTVSSVASVPALVPAVLGTWS